MMTKWSINLLSFLCGYLDILLLILFIQQVSYQVVGEFLIFIGRLLGFSILISFGKIILNWVEGG